MAHLEGKPELPQAKRVFIAQVRKVADLEAMEREQQDILNQLIDAIEDTEECARKYRNALGRKQVTEHMLRKIQGKLKNLRRVKNADWKLNHWYKILHWGRVAYVYPLRTTPAGRVRCIVCVHHDRWYAYHCSDENYNGPYWDITESFYNSRDLQKASRLEILVTIGNLDRLRRHWESHPNREDNWCLYVKDDPYSSELKELKR